MFLGSWGIFVRSDLLLCWRRNWVPSLMCLPDTAQSTDISVVTDGELKNRKPALILSQSKDFSGHWIKSRWSYFSCSVSVMTNMTQKENSLTIC
ncbi:unnamed protein product [Caretta caretta]